MSAQTWRDAHKGQPAYCLGGGVSLERQRPEPMAGAVVFGTNEQIWAPARLGLPALDYWVFYDGTIPARLPVNFYNRPLKIVLEPAARMLRRQGFRDGDGRGNTFALVGRGGRPFRDAEEIYEGGSSLLGAVHLAWIMGCRPVHVRGLDLERGPDGRAHWWETKGARASADSEAWRRMAPCFRALFSAMQADGVAVTVGRGTKLAGEFPAGD